MDASFQKEDSFSENIFLEQLYDKYNIDEKLRVDGLKRIKNNDINAKYDPGKDKIIITNGLLDFCHEISFEIAYLINRTENNNAFKIYFEHAKSIFSICNEHIKHKIINNICQRGYPNQEKIRREKIKYNGNIIEFILLHEICHSLQRKENKLQSLLSNMFISPLIPKGIILEVDADMWAINRMVEAKKTEPFDKELATYPISSVIFFYILNIYYYIYFNEYYKIGSSPIKIDEKHYPPLWRCSLIIAFLHSINKKFIDMNLNHALLKYNFSVDILRILKSIKSDSNETGILLQQIELSFHKIFEFNYLLANQFITAEELEAYFSIEFLQDQLILTSILELLVVITISPEYGIIAKMHKISKYFKFSILKRAFIRIYKNRSFSNNDVTKVYFSLHNSLLFLKDIEEFAIMPFKNI